jgi:hypothetical protein
MGTAELYISLLELFEGKVSLQDMKTLSLPELYKLRDAKLKLIKEKQELQRKMEEKQKAKMDAQKKKNSPSKRKH